MYGVAGGLIICAAPQPHYQHTTPTNPANPTNPPTFNLTTLPTQVTSSNMGLIWALCYSVIPAYLERVFEARHDKVVKFNSIDGSALGSNIGSQRSTAFNGSAFNTDESTRSVEHPFLQRARHSSSAASSAQNQRTLTAQLIYIYIYIL